MNVNKKFSVINLAVLLLAGLIAVFMSLRIFSMLANVISISAAANISSECRDFVSFRITKAFLENINPYTLEALSGHVPLADLYTLLQPLCVAVICKITGTGILEGNFAFNMLCVLGTAICIFFIMQSSFNEITKGVKGIILILCIFSVSGTFFTMFTISFFTFRPDSIGILLTAALMLVVNRCPQRTFLAAFISVMLIHAKQILIIIAFPVFVYYLVNNKTLALKYFLYCLLLGIITLVAVYYIFPLYWGSCIFAQSKIIHTSRSYALRNIIKCCVKYYAFIIMGLAGTAAALFLTGKNIFAKLRHDYILFIILYIISSLVCLLWVAGAGGDGLKYCFAMLAPPMVIFALSIWKFVNVKSCEKFILVLSAAACLVTFRNFGRLKYTLNDMINYSKLWETIRAYDTGEKYIYLGMSANNYLLKEENSRKNYILFEDGHTEYFIRQINKASRLDNLFAELLYVDKIYGAFNDYAARVNEMISKKEFALIVIPWSDVINKDKLNENYKILQELECRNSIGQNLAVKLYVPKQ